jgi:aminoglycoside phosphotransferase family enzyme/predicted kinase
VTAEPDTRSHLPPLLRALAEPALHDGADVQLRETHASWVVLAGELAWKVKKPLVFAFLDQSTPERRRAACEAELELNRPLAPDVYLAVRGLAPDGDGVRLTGAEDPDAVEYAVEMRRFDERETLAGLVARDALEDRHLELVARRLAEFHAQAPVAPPGDAPHEPAPAAAAALERLNRNGEELIVLLDAAARDAVLAQLRAAARYAVDSAELLAARARAGLVRELHGDLRAEHALPGPPVRLVDRLEFNRAWREVDVADELAFLAMDLTALGRPDAATTLLAAYRAAGGDAGEDRLVAFHAVYRAHVRAKVSLLRAAQERAEGEERAAVAERARAAGLLAVAERFAWRLRLPPVLVVCGPSASGKSVLAAELAGRSGLPAISSDVVRKRLAGVEATARAGAEVYDEAMNARTYEALGRAAAEAAATGGGAIVDATFRRRADREAFRAGLGEGVPVVYVELTAAPEVLRARAERRLRDAARISDGTPELALAQLAEFAPLTEVPPADHHLLRADREPEALAAALAAALDG